MKPTFWLALGALTLASCAQSPSGGPTRRAPNRLGVTLNLAQNLDPNFYYALAFDDLPGDGRGPNAIVGNTTVRNGVMDGEWRVLVLYHLNRFRVFYRTTPNDAATEVETLSSPFFTSPTAAGNRLAFTLDLDAKMMRPPIFSITFSTPKMWLCWRPTVSTSTLRPPIS